MKPAYRACVFFAIFIGSCLIFNNPLVIIPLCAGWTGAAMIDMKINSNSPNIKSYTFQGDDNDIMFVENRPEEPPLFIEYTKKEFSETFKQLTQRE